MQMRQIVAAIAALRQVALLRGPVGQTYDCMGPSFLCSLSTFLPFNSFSIFVRNCGETIMDGDKRGRILGHVSYEVWGSLSHAENFMVEVRW